jgi:hypothetical protein
VAPTKGVMIMAWDLFFMDLGLFASKSFLVVFSIGLVLVLIAILVARASDKFEIEVQINKLS